MELLDITSEGLSNEGYSLKKEDKTIALYHNGSSCIRSDFDKNKWNSTVDKFERKLSDEGVPQLIISAALKDMSDNYGN